MKKRIFLLWATFFGVGHIPVVPATWASLVTAIIVFVVYPHLSNPYSLLLATFIVFMTGIPAANQAELHYLKKDPSFCVIDEVAGQLLALFLVPHTIAFYILAFLLFRFFDILKPFPIKQSEQLPHGLGIMSDDVLAGAYSSIVLNVIRVVFFKQALGI